MKICTVSLDVLLFILLMAFFSMQEKIQPKKWMILGKPSKNILIMIFSLQIKSLLYCSSKMHPS